MPNDDVVIAGDYHRVGKIHTAYATGGLVKNAVRVYVDVLCWRGSFPLFNGYLPQEICEKCRIRHLYFKSIFSIFHQLDIFNGDLALAYELPRSFVKPVSR